MDIGLNARGIDVDFDVSERPRIRSELGTWRWRPSAVLKMSHDSGLKILLDLHWTCNLT